MTCNHFLHLMGVQEPETRYWTLLKIHFRILIVDIILLWTLYKNQSLHFGIEQDIYMISKT